MKKMLKYFALLLLVLPIFSLNGAKVEAAENVNIILHKITFPNGKMPADIPNTGNLAGEHQDLLQEYEGLNGVTFEAYDVTEEFYQLRSEGSTVEQAQQVLSQKDVVEFSEPAVAHATTENVAGEDGTASFDLSAVDSQGRDKVYLFYEADAPHYIEQKAKNMVVVLPVYTTENELLSTIHLYPKNEEMVHVEPPLEKIVPGQVESYQFGDVLDYQISTKVPVNIAKYDLFHISDESDPGLVYQEGTLQVKIGNEVLADEHYDFVKTDSGFTVQFKNCASLVEHIGKDIVFQYKTQLVEVKTETNTFKNIARLKTTFEEKTKEVEVKTGGMRFTKVDLEDDSLLLAGAKFQVLNDKKQYLSKTAGAYSWTDDAKAENLVELTSDEKGQFEINGLTFGDYYLQETVAPKGYELSATPVKFTVSEGSYTAGDAGTLKVVNLKTPERPVLPGTSGDPVTPDTPARKVLPKTGETKNSSFIWLGAILIAGVAIVLWQKNRKNGSERE